MRIRARQGDTLDLAIWRELGVTRGVVEQALELNRGNVEPDALLREGQEIILPDTPPPSGDIISTINLWD